MIGTTVTDTNGLFTFAGLTGNGAYTTRISDTSGFLQNYYGTTPFATAKQRAEGVLAGNVDRSGAPSYAFRASRSIGDTVFNDVNANGTQDNGEPGVAGVVMTLYRDANANGHIDAAGVDCPPAASCLVGTVATDANGQYQFPGLTDGAAYIVSVASPPSGYTYTGVGVHADSDPAAAGQQQSRTASSAGNVTNADFPYDAQTPRTISGVVWNDADANGSIGGSEAGRAGVTLDILFAGTVVATVTTDATGAYSAADLAGLPDYTVRLTDTNGALNGYTATSERTEGTTGPFNYLEDVDLSGGNVINVNFGYRRPVPTYAAIAYLTAYPDAGSVTVEWRTSLEVGTAGFHLLRLDPATGDFVKLTERLLPGLIVHPQGGVYRFRDTGAPTEGLLTYKLIEQDVRGRLREYGPYRVPASGGAAPRAVDRGLEDLRGFSRQAARPSRAGLAIRSTGGRRAAASGVAEKERPAGAGRQGHDARRRASLSLLRGPGSAPRRAGAQGRGPHRHRSHRVEQPRPRRALPAGRQQHRPVLLRRARRQSVHGRERLLGHVRHRTDHAPRGLRTRWGPRHHLHRDGARGAGPAPPAHQLPGPTGGLLGLGLALCRLRRDGRPELHVPRGRSGRVR